MYLRWADDGLPRAARRFLRLRRIVCRRADHLPPGGQPVRMGEMPIRRRYAWDMMAATR